MESSWEGGKNPEVTPSLSLDDLTRELSAATSLAILLEAREGRFDPRIPHRPSASPIDTRVPYFYVLPRMERNLSRPDSELRVKYNNCARSRVYWSESHGLLKGVVVRAMSLNTRSEPATGAKSFSHGYRGHWISLVERKSALPLKDKTEIRLYVQDSAPGLVQFWLIQEELANQKIESVDSGVLRLNILRRPSMDEAAWRFFPAAASVDVPLDDLEIDAFFAEKETQRKLKYPHRSTDDLLLNASSPSPSEEEILLDILESNPKAAKKIEEVKSNGGLDESVEGALLAFEWFKAACDIMNEDEFVVWYNRHVSKLFDSRISKELNLVIRNNDPRIDPAWLFPDYSQFDSSVPIGNASFEGNYATGVKFSVVDQQLIDLIGYDPTNQDYESFYSNMLDSKIVDLFMHIIYKLRVKKGSINELNYWHQAIVRFPNGRRIVCRAHCHWFEPTKLRTRMQDVSHLYEDLLNLPALPY